MRKHAIGVFVAAGLILGGCASTGDRPSFENIVSQTQNIAVRVCSFLPTANTILEILSVGSPALSTASAIANAICAAVVTESRQVRRGTSPKVATVGGVVVRGKFVK